MALHANTPAISNHGILKWIAGMQAIPEALDSEDARASQSDAYDSDDNADVDWDAFRSTCPSPYSISSMSESASASGSLPSTRPASMYSRPPGMPRMPAYPRVRYSMSDIIADRLARAADPASSDEGSASENQAHSRGSSIYFPPTKPPAQHVPELPSIFETQEDIGDTVLPPVPLADSESMIAPLESDSFVAHDNGRASGVAPHSKSDFLAQFRRRLSLRSGTSSPDLGVER